MDATGHTRAPMKTRYFLMTFKSHSGRFYSNANALKMMNIF